MTRCLWLIIRGLPPEVWSRRIKSRKQIIGRGVDCAIQLFDEKVSRQHAKIWERGGIAFIRDMNSRNGTYVDGVRVTRCALVSGKSFRIGDITFEVVASQTRVQNRMRAGVSSPTVKHEIPPGVINTNFAGLSDGQRQVLRLLVQGASEKEAAASLNLSYHTIHAHLKQVYRQLEVRSRAELVARCLARSETPPAIIEPAAQPPGR